MAKWKAPVLALIVAAAVAVPIAATASTQSSTPAGAIAVPFAGNQLDAIASKAAKKKETSAQWVYNDVKGDLPKPSPSPSSPSPSPTPSPSPSAPSTPTPTPTSTPSPTPSSTAQPGSLPSQVLDLTNWKVTLPVDSKGNASTSCSPQEITQPALASFTDQWFKTTAAGDGVMFRANIEGCTTSSSSYPRSELREMANGGKDEASWSTTSGTNTMTLTEAITHLPVAKPQTVFAQVHNGSDDVAFAEATGNKDGTETLDFNHNGTSWGTLDASYTPGTHFTLKIVAASGFIDVYFNGVQDVHHAVSSSGCYFKAGDYTQSNISKGHDAPGAYGEVVIYNLAVSHS